MNKVQCRRSGAALRRVALAALTGAGLLVALAPNAGATSTSRVPIGAGAPVGSGATVVAVPANVSFSVVLRPGHAEELAAFIAEVTTPGTALYHHYLHRGQFAARFGASTAARARVASFFRGYGLKVTTSRDNSLLLRVSGPSRGVADAFSASLVAVRAYGSVATQFNGAASLPRDVARDLSGVSGLSTWRRPHQLYRPVTSRLRTNAAAHTVQVPGTCAGASSEATKSPGEFLPNQQAQAYGIDRQWAKGFNGAGQTIAVYELTNYQASDISTYFNCFSLTPNITNVGVDGGPGFGDTNSNTIVEASLDIEEAGVLAPGANIIVYKGPNNSSGPIDVYGAIAQADQATVATTSWGMCETALGQADAISSEAPFFAQMAAQGQSIMAAAGDDGSSDCASSTGDYTINVDDPASQPFVTGVGGLTVNTIASTSPPSVLSQTVWNSGGAGGGGISQVWGQPKWQTGDGVPSLGHRLVPDLSVMGDPSTGFITYANGSWMSVGGTSIGSPIMAAIVATANQACGGAVGFINPTLYAMAAHGTGFNDVTTGNNALYFEAGGNYAAGPGYDLASGLGSPDPATFINGLCSALPAVANSSVTYSPVRPIAISASARVTVTVRNALSQGIGFVSPIVTATEPGALPVVTALGSATNSSGQIAYLVSTNVPGPVTVSATIGTTSLGTTEVTFVSTSTVSPRALADLPTPASLQRAAGTTSTQSVVIGVSPSGHVLATSSPTRITDFTARFHLHSVLGAPAIGCAGASCMALVDAGGHLVAIYNVNTPATSQVVDFGQRYSAAANVQPGSIALDDHRGAGYFDATYLNPAHHILLAHYNVATRSLGFTNLTSKDHLGLAFGATSVVDASATQHYVAARIGPSDWLIADGAASGPENVAAAAHYGAAGGAVLNSPPTLQRDVHTGQISMLARSVGGAVVLFTSSAGAPSKLTHYVVVSYGGSTSEAFVLNSDVTQHDVVVYTSAGHLRLASFPSWQSFDVTSPAPVAAPQMIAGPRPLVLASGAYYAVSP